VVAHLALPDEPVSGRVSAVTSGPAAGSGPEGEEPAADSAPARVGFVVSGAVGPAVVRNRVRRRLRHLAVDQLRRLPDGTLLVLRALPAAAGATSGQLAADLNRVLDRLVPRSTPPSPGVDVSA
jgi:ribonuclease P protein component